MIAQPDERLMSLFEVAVDLEPDRRARFLEHACPDPALRRKLEAMLSADRRSTRSVLSPPPAPARVRAATSDDSDTVHTAPPDEWLPPVPHTGHSNEQTVALLAAPAPRRAPPGEPRRPQKPAPVHAPPDTSDIGHIIRPGTHIQHYELIREIGRGGMGAVYKARDTKLGRRVAIKFLHTDDSKLTERFVLEARATARCSHENIVVIHDVSHYQAIPYMVLEFLEGQPLSKLVGDERIPPGRAVQLLVPVVRALVCAHQHKIVHRDLKPANILMTDSGTIKVLDFGIAKFVYDMPQLEAMAESRPGAPSTVEFAPGANLELTGRGSLVGTLPYMSPEQWGVDTVDHRTDIWAVGIMLYRMICGRHPLGPLRGEQFMVTALLDQPMPSAHAAGVDMPLGLADIIDSCLKKHKHERMPSAARLLSALERYLPGSRPTEIDSEDCPYAGLGAFQEADANRFFGRAREIAGVVTRLHSSPLLALAGPSGAGKSSLVRAGVIPALQQTGETWESLVIRPGRHPMAALANLIVPIITGSTSLSEQVAEHQKAQQRLYAEPGYLGTVLRARARAQHGKLLLFIDQFEELFTLSPDRAERQAFTACLAGMADDALSPLRLMLSIRSDFLDRLAEDPHFMTQLVQGLLFIGPPDRSGLRDAIVKPAELLRYRFENPSMVEHMLDTLHATSGCLPLLQFAASKLWDTRDQERRVLTQESYDALGGVAGALATHADAVLASMSPRDQRLVRTIFLCLVTPERTRAIKSIDELRELGDAGQDIDRLVAHLVDARLLIVQKGERSGKSAVGTVEMVHESMIHSWPTLAHWLDENQDDAVFLEQLHIAARQWDARARSSELLWRGEPLAEAETWRKRYKDKLPRLQEEFLQAAFAQAARATRLKRWAVAGSMVFLSVIAVAAVVALMVIRDAEQALRAKEQARQAALAKMEDAQSVESMTREELEEANTELKLRVQEADEARKTAELARRKAEEAEALESRAIAQLGQQKRELEKSLEESRAATNQAIASRVEAEMALKDAEKARVEAERSRVEAEKAEAAAEEARSDAQRNHKEALKAMEALAAEIANRGARIKALEEARDSRSRPVSPGIPASGPLEPDHGGLQ